jgi:phosphatidylserine/phosphatidylglycerophosphate/cardiolipin synthase-like enzyme
MADVQVFFNRPLNPVNLDQLCNDLRHAADRVAIASAWFTDTSIAEAFIASPAFRKVAVFNQHDLSRGSRKAVDMVQKHIAGVMKSERAVWDARSAFVEKTYPTWRQDWDAGAMPASQIQEKLQQANREANDALPFVCIGKMGVIGSKDWQNGIMHHKFIIADDVVWFGSFNFTYNARNNYETLARVDDDYTAGFFWIEAECMVDDEGVWDEEGNSGAYGGFLAVCSICGKKMLANRATAIDSHGGIGCPECANKTEW